MKPGLIKLMIGLNIIIFVIFIIVMLSKDNKDNEVKGYVDTSHYGTTTVELDTITIDHNNGTYTFIGKDLIVLDPNGNEIEFDNDGNSTNNE